jgi:hypothetical protein
MPFLKEPRSIQVTPRIQYAPNMAGLVVGFGVLAAGIAVIAASLHLFGGVEKEKNRLPALAGLHFHRHGAHAPAPHVEALALEP